MLSSNQEQKGFLKREIPSDFLYLSIGLLLLIALGTFLKAQLRVDLLTLEGLRAFREVLLEFGFWTPVIYCLIYACRSVIYLPEFLLMMMAGFLVGPFYGMVLVFCGCLLSASLAFGIAKLLSRFGGRSLLEKILKNKLKTLEKMSAQFGYKTILIWRMMPFFPFTMISYGSALMKIPFHRYILAMGIGIWSPAFLYSFLGSTVMDPETLVHGWPYLTGFICLILSLGYFSFLRLRKSKSKPIPFHA